jgi:hypothetical protein
MSNCYQCKKVLGDNRYVRSPITGQKFKGRAWCPDCFENTLRLSGRDRCLEGMELQGLKDNWKTK